MKNKIIVLGIALLGYVTVSFAQEKRAQQPRQRSEVRAQNKTPEQMAEQRTQRLDKIVSLTSDQKQKAHHIYLKQAKETKERMAVRKEDQKEIESILTAEQNQKMEEAKQQKMDRMKTRENRMQGVNTNSVRENK